MGDKITDLRHPEWEEFARVWAWLYDSWEGGERYRQATYGSDPQGVPLYNLVRHKREYPEPRSSGGGYTPLQTGSDPTTRSTDDDFELRRARTPIPALTEGAIEAHLSKIYAQEIDREASERIKEWWDDVDGRNTPVDIWMQDLVAPLTLALGCLDLCFDHQLVAPDFQPRSRGDEIRFGSAFCIASHILPQNTLWWELDNRGRYQQMLIQECDKDGSQVYRHWTPSDWTLYDEKGKRLDSSPHGFGRPPIIRVFDRRLPRTENVGKPRYYAIADIQREFYNRDSELILSDTTQAHPLLQGPEDYIQNDGTIPVGPNWLLPKKKNASGTTVDYEGFSVVEFPKEGADSIRQNKRDLRDEADRLACLTKPAGASGTSGSTVAQSGVSKRLDQVSGNDLLGKLSRTLASIEVQIAEMALLVLSDGVPNAGEADGIKVVYPRAFDLLSPEELAANIAEFQAILSSSGEAPKTEKTLLSTLARLLLPGLDREDYQEIEDEIEEAIDRKAKNLELTSEAARVTAGPIEVTSTMSQPAETPTDPSTAKDMTNG